MTSLTSHIPAPDHLAIAIRTYADHGSAKPSRDFPYIPSLWKLIFDCETTTDESQALRFGAFQLREGEELAEHGFFYDPLGLSPAEFALINDFAQARGCLLITVDEFIENYFYKFGLDLGSPIVGLNLPFDISRLAKDHGVARGSMKDGFTFRLSDKLHHRPNVKIKHLSSRMALIQFAGPFMQRRGRGMRRRGGFVPIERGTFIDVRTLAAALLSKSYSLAGLAEHLHVEHKKMDVDSHGEALDDSYLEYSLRDVQTTWECYGALEEKYKALRLSTPIHKIMSEAGLGKAYLKDIGIKPWRECQPDFPSDLLGKILSTYYGGRSEVHIRRQVQRVIYCDFLSMYPTVCTLMGLWKYVTSDGVEWRDATGETRELLNEINTEDLQNPEIWKRLAVIVKLAPNTDLFPVRAEYVEGSGTSIGLNYLTSEEPLYYTLADCIVSKLLSGKIPQIEEATAFEPRAQQEGLEPIYVGGRTDCSVNPYKEDFYKRLIELRQEIKRQAKTANGPARQQLDTAQLALKIAANATSYGIFVEINVRDERNKRPVCCYGPGNSFEAQSKKTEQPGRYFHPLLATLITGAARLLLALVERKVGDEGLDWALCDTDSMAIARPDGMADARFVQKTLSICQWFDALNPYAIKGALLKIEDDNYSLEEPSEISELFCFAVSAKRYALFNMANGKPIIRKVSSHGLGHLLAPYSKDNPSKKIPAPLIKLEESGVPLWHHDIWHQIIMAELEGHGAQVSLIWHPNFKQPAMSQYRASSPALFGWFKTLNRSRDYRAKVKPFNFVLTQMAGSDFLHTKVKAVAPFDKDHKKALQKALTALPVRGLI